MIPRIASGTILKALGRQAAVVLLGPRQVGKTTLAIEVGKGLDSIYLDLERRDDRERLDNPSLYLESVADKLVILDEIHRVPALFETLRGVIDLGRRTGRRTGRFLMLGSASLDLLRQSGETLAGRVSYIELGPLSPLEVDADAATRDRLWLRGGFPDSFLAADDRASLEGRQDLIRTYLERDVPMFGPRIPATTLERLWTMLAHRQGGMLNAAEIGRSLEISTQTVTRYIDLLVDLLLVRRLPPYHANVGKRLVKSPKVYVRDSGILHALLGIETLDRLQGHPVIGASWEGFVLETLLASLPWRGHAFFYRTARGAEIDLIVEHGDGSLWAIEIKRSRGPKLERGFHFAWEDLKPKRGFVVHAGDDRYPISADIEAIGLQEMAEELRAAG